MISSFHRSGRVLLPALFAIVMGSCKDEELPEPQLPEPTQTGANTIGCKVDGRNWVAASGGLFGGKPMSARLFHFEGANEFNLLATNTPVDEAQPLNKTFIKLFIEDLKATGTYLLVDRGQPNNQVNGPSYAMFTDYKVNPNQEFITTPGYTGKIVVTRLDTVKHIVAGTFEFSAQDRFGTKTVKVTDGRFDATY